MRSGRTLGFAMIILRSASALLNARNFRPRMHQSQWLASSTSSGEVHHPLAAEVSTLANEIRAMKAASATKDDVMAKVSCLNALKAELAAATGQPAPTLSLSKREKADAARKSRFASTGGRVPPPPGSFPAGSYDKRPFFHHEVTHVSTKSGARVGKIHTPHGVIDTPGFVCVATNGALKALSIEDAADAGQQLIFANSYHLMLQPGGDIIEQAGGLHKFMRHDGPLITDSGG